MMDARCEIGSGSECSVCVDCEQTIRTRKPLKEVGLKNTPIYTKRKNV